ncbi:MAG: SDR family oxidoreductase [Chitinophagaceae bacterium]|jgi:NAD(P)-dependent dehydrogenase (short-subunit alcohol dehydrogenase family)|nr:SDR family oxidoreductase [Chitinophagaceae bacterium]
MAKNFAGKVAIVTGAGSGIGEACALLFAQKGAQVVVSDINEAAGTAVVEKILQSDGDAYFIKADVSKPEDAENLTAETIRQYGRLDVAVNNAGIGGESNPIADMSVQGWDKIIAVNLSSLFYCMKYQIPAMLKNGKGAIVNMASILGQVGFLNSAGYVAAKHGVVGLTQNAALEYSAQGLRINAVGPGFIDTPLLTALDAEVKKALVDLHPIGRLGKSEEVAELVVWLSSDKASFVTGSYYPIDGAYLAR